MANTGVHKLEIRQQGNMVNVRAIGLGPKGHRYTLASAQYPAGDFVETWLGGEGGRFLSGHTKERKSNS